jgi:hypothetical protein
MDAREVGAEVIEQARAIAGEVAREAREFIASDTGRKVRNYAATGLILAAPAVASMPFVKRTRLARLIEIGGGAALIVKVAEKIRDWEPDGSGSGGGSGASRA